MSVCDPVPEHSADVMHDDGSQHIYREEEQHQMQQMNHNHQKTQEKDGQKVYTTKCEPEVVVLTISSLTPLLTQRTRPLSYYCRVRKKIPMLNLLS